jgi:predicted 3-demethylubiquinone-9 3-methyltransferase (glyoxalase superfamily)
MKTTIRPFLMFEGKAEEAIRFYVSLFPGAEIHTLEKYGAAGPGKEGTVAKALFTVAGQTVQAFDSFVNHGFTFTAAWSFFVDCESEDLQKRLVEKLSEGGNTMMPLGNYGFSKQFAWVSDRFGVSWQLNLP